MDFESVVFWVARFAIIHTIKLKLPLLNLIINTVFFHPFLFETYYFTALFCDIWGLNFSLPISFKVKVETLKIFSSYYENTNILDNTLEDEIFVPVTVVRMLNL